MAASLAASAAPAAAAAATSPRLSSIEFGRGGEQEIQVEQEYSNAEEGSVVWDASRSFLAHITQMAESGNDPIAGKRLLEIGAGTGVVGLALARLGARSVIMTDKDSQLPLMRRNCEHNQPPCCADRCKRCEHIAPVQVLPLRWGPDWQSESDPALTAPDAFDVIVVCDCVYPDRPSGLAGVLLDLLALNPAATILISSEKRPPPASAGPGVDHFLDFFAAIRAGCEVERVADAELDREWLCEEISLYRMRARGGP